MPVDATNFRKAAQVAIDSYRRRGALGEALLWRSFVDFYEAEITRFGTLCERVQGVLDTGGASVSALEALRKALGALSPETPPTKR